MMPETTRHAVSRLWLYAFAGIVAVLFASPTRAGELALEQVLPNAPFSQSAQGSRHPIAAFATANGVYELDATEKKAVRVWPRSAEAGELTQRQLEGREIFSKPVAFVKKPGENIIAVLDACPTVEGLGRYSRVAFYSFEETLNEKGVLSKVSFTLEGEIRNEALEHASGVAFFPSGDKVAVSISRFSSGPSADDEGAVQFYDVPASADTPVTDPVNSFLCVRTKNTYEGTVSNTGAEPYNVPITGVCVDPDGKRIWTASKSLSAVIRYDPVAGNAYDELIWIRTWEFDMINGPWWNPEYDVFFPAATADFVQGTVGVTNLTSNTETNLYSTTAVPGFNAGDIGTSGSTNNLLSAPGTIQMWNSPHGNLLVVADTDNDRVVAFDAMGNARFTFNPTDRQAAKFARPNSAWISEDGTELVVADTGHGRVEIFALEDSDSAPDETIGLRDETPPFYWESDATAISNWIVAVSPSLTNRTYSVSVEPASFVRVEPASVTIPAGADRAPFALVLLDGVEDGTLCTLTVSGWGTNAVFVISNAPPSVRTGPPTALPDFDNGSYLYVEEGDMMTVGNKLIPMDYNPGLVPVTPDAAGAIHLHAKAFDVEADEPTLSYEWRILGTMNTLDDPVYKRTPYYYYEYEEGVPPEAKTKTFTPEESADFPTDSAGNRLYLRVYHDAQAPDEDFVVTNVLSYAETTNKLNRSKQLDWAAFLYDDDQGADFVCYDATLSGADATFSGVADGVTYFAVLTVTDKDGGVWRSLSSPDESYVCFAAGGGGPIPPQPSTAVYSAVFTAMSPTNVAFVVTLVSGEPADNDTVTLESAPDFVAGPWTKVKKYTIGNRLSTTSEPTEAHRSFPVDFDAEYMSACDSLGQKFTPSLAWGTNDALPLTYEQVSNIANDGNSIFTDNEKAVAQRILVELGTIFSDRYTNLPGLTSDDLAVLKVRVVSQSEIDVIYPSTKTVASTDPLEYSFSPSQNILFFRVVQP